MTNRWRPTHALVISLALAACTPTTSPTVPAPAPPGARPRVTRPAPPPRRQVTAPRYATRVTWWASALRHRRLRGHAVSVYCPPAGRPGNIWGSGPYTNDSSICTAAVHAGVITRRAGGAVTIRITGAQTAYGASRRHGVSSRAYGRWPGSFHVIWGRAGYRPRLGRPHSSTIHWHTTATAYRGKAGTRVRVQCPPGGPLRSVWGTYRYTDDSSICAAAVHAGVIKRSGGGPVTLVLRPGQKRYVGSQQNGVVSRSYGPWKASFDVVGAQRMSTPLAGSATVPGIHWSTNALPYRGQTGRRFTFRCPATQRPGNVWGTVLYTDDSSICSAAVHAGRLTLAGGVVTIEIAAGAPRYPGSTQHGVTSRIYGAWHGSFAFP